MRGGGVDALIVGDPGSMQSPANTVGRCSLTVSKPVLKAPMVSTLDPKM